MISTPPVLTPRLSAVANEIGTCKCLSDIGTDHAYLPVYMCLENKCKTAIASDINKGPLMRAEATVSSYGLSDRIALRLGGGLSVLEENEADAVSITGMGGLLIAKILNDGITKLKTAKKIVLQPMSSIPELRDYLYCNGWKIIKETLAKEDEKIYTIITIEAPERKSFDNITPSYAELFVGKYLIENKPKFFDEYLEKKLGKLHKIIKELKNSKTDTSIKKLKLSKETLAELEGIKNTEVKNV